MSQQRMRKAPVALSGEGGPCPRGFVPKASGDTVPCNIRPKQQLQRSGSKNKIPKSIRYDLENALVGLCDVWFEDIKPHLVRNNIKVHVHGGGGGGGAASGDYSRPPAPRAAPGCSHLDPASSAPGCELCRLLFNAANSIESAVSQAACVIPCAPSPATALAAFPSRDVYTGKVVGGPPHLPKYDEWFSPMYSGKGILDDEIARLSPLVSRMSVIICYQDHRHNYEDQSKSRSRRKSRSSKSPTPVPNWRVPRLCRTNPIISPSATPRTHMRRIQTAILGQSPPRDDSFFQFIQPRRRVKMKHKSTQTEHPSCWGRPAHAVLRPAPAPFGRCPATTTFFPPRYKTSEYRAHPLRAADEPLFKQDLVNIIGEKNDKRIKLLYKYKKKEEECPSVMNLILSADDGPTESCGFKKKPWR